MENRKESELDRARLGCYRSGRRGEIIKNQLTRVNGADIYWVEEGRGDPLLFLHGLGYDGRWTPFLSRMSQYFRVVVPHHPGFCQSQFNPELRRVGDVAKAYEVFSREIGLPERFLVCGTSLGGWIAAEWLSLGRGFAGMVLIAPAGAVRPDLAQRDTLGQSLQEFEEEVRRRLSVEGSTRALAAFVRNRMTIAYLMASCPHGDPHLLDRVKRSPRCPSLVIWGKDDQVISPTYAALWQEALGGQLAITTGGHTVADESFQISDRSDS